MKEKVQIVEGDPPVRRVRFYRQTDQGWLHTAPDLAFWQAPIEERYGEQLAFFYHQRDQPYVEPLLEQLSQTFFETCASAGCEEGKRFEVLLYPAHPGSDTQADMTLPSPWLSGIPVEGDWSEGLRQAAADAVARLVRLMALESSEASPPSSRYPERWLGFWPATPETAYLWPLVTRRGGDFRGRPNTGQRQPETSPFN